MYAQAMANQVKRGIVFPPQARNLATRILDFVRMNTPEYYGSKVDEDPMEFLDEANWIVEIIRCHQIKRLSLWPINSRV